jgi:hypothetical protein
MNVRVDHCGVPGVTEQAGSIVRDEKAKVAQEPGGQRAFASADSQGGVAELSGRYIAHLADTLDSVRTL